MTDTPCILHHPPGRVTTATVRIPDPGPGEVRVRTIFSAISPGTEMRALAGKQEGAPSEPFIPGYSLVGEISAVGHGVDLAVGTRVFSTGTIRVEGAARCWGAHVGLALQRAGGVLPIPEGADLESVALAKLLAIVTRGYKLAAPAPGSGVAVVGLGPIGSLSARLFAHHGCRVVAIDRVPERLQAVAPYVAETIRVEAGTAPPASRLLPEGADVVVDATGVPGALSASIGWARDKPWGSDAGPGAKLVIQGSYPARFEMDYNEAFGKELTISFPRDQEPGDLREAVALIASGRIVTRDLISRIVPYASAPALYRQLVEDPGSVVTGLFSWD